MIACEWRTPILKHADERARRNLVGNNIFHHASQTKPFFGSFINDTRIVEDIPGTTKMHRLEENLGSADLALTDTEICALTDAADAIVIEGGRSTGHETYG